MISPSSKIVTPSLANSVYKVIPLSLSLWANLSTPLMIDTPLHIAASATKGGNKSGQSVASNLKACNQFKPVPMVMASFST